MQKIRSGHCDAASVKDTHVTTGVRVHFLYSDPIFTASIFLKLSACR